MRRIDTEKELYTTITHLKKTALFKINQNVDAPIKFLKELGAKNADIKYNCMSYHEILLFKNDILHLKIPSLYGKFLSFKRFIEEKKFNEECIIKENTKEAILREIDTYTNLNKIGFPTLECLNHKFPDISGIVITRNIPDVKHTIDLISQSDNSIQQKYVCEVTGLMKRLHDTETIWCDSGLGNSIYDDKNVARIFDFGFKPNPIKNQAFLKGKDLVFLCTSAVHRTGQPIETIVPLVLETYNPSSEIANSIKHSVYLQSTEKINSNPIKLFLEEELYFRSAYGMNRKKIEKIREEIYKNL